MTVMAFIPVDMSVVGVGSSVNIEASSSLISDGSSVSVEPSDVLESFLSVVSHDGGVTIVTPVVTSSLDGDGLVSVREGSDRFGSLVEHEPLLVVVWVSVSDSQSVLMASDMLGDDQGSVGWHGRLDLESKSVSQWVSWEVNTLLVEVPSLVCTVVASPEDSVSVVVVVTSMDIEAESGNISDVSSASWPEGGSLVSLGSPLSDDSSATNVELRAVLVREGEVSLLLWSDGSSSSVEEEPLSWVPWLGVMDSESVLVSTNVLVPEEGLASRHS